jgi:anti-anti-sigma factor
MEIQEKKKKDIMDLKLSGRLDTSNYREAETKFKELTDKGELKITVDLEKLEYISSAGLRAFLSALKYAKSKGGKLVIYKVPDKILEVFNMSGFNKFLEICKTEAEAVKSF